MKRHARPLSLAVLAALGLTAGCTMTPQDTGTGGEGAVTGLAVDGYLAGAVVYVDTNGNNALDAWEPSAITDADGYYSYNPNDRIDYCALPAGDARRAHCLSAPQALGEVLLRVSGGYDLITKEPFEGSMAVRIDLAQAGDGAAQVVLNPLTTLLEGLAPEVAQTWLDNEGLTLEAIQGDLLEGLAVAEDRSDENDAVSAADVTPVALAWKLHKLVDVLAARIGAAYPDQFGGQDQPEDATHVVYQALAQALADALVNDANATLASVTDAAQALEGVIQTAQTRLAAAGFDGGLDAAGITRLASWGAAFAQKAGTLFGSVGNKGDLEARARAIEVIVALMRDGTRFPLSDTLPAEIDNALALAGDATYLTHLRSNKVDVNHLVGRFKTGQGGLTAADADYSARKTIAEQMGVAELAGTTLDMSKDGTQNAALTFNEDGTLSADIQFDDPDLQIANDQPLTGTWEQVDDYTMVLNLEVAEGVTMPVVVKTDIDGNYTFDLGGEQATWLQQQQSQP